MNGIVAKQASDYIPGVLVWEHKTYLLQQLYHRQSRGSRKVRSLASKSRKLFKQANFSAKLFTGTNVLGHTEKHPRVGDYKEDPATEFINQGGTKHCGE